MTSSLFKLLKVQSSLRLVSSNSSGMPTMVTTIRKRTLSQTRYARGLFLQTAEIRALKRTLGQQLTRSNVD